MLKKRIDILRNAEVINNQTYEYLIKVIIELEQRYENKMNILEMFTTHLAMATQRILDEKEMEELDEAIWVEVCGSNVFNLANETCDDILKDAPCEFPDSERKFLIMHLCNLHQ